MGESPPRTLLQNSPAGMIEPCSQATVACLVVGASNRNYLEVMDLHEVRRIVKPICQRFRVQSLDLFGSRAAGGEHIGSDFDFCVSFDDLPPGEYSRCFFGLLHDLEDTLKEPIDLLTCESVRRPALRRSIENHRVRVYG